MVVTCTPHWHHVETKTKATQNKLTNPNNSRRKFFAHSKMVSNTTNLGQSEPGSNGNEEYSTFLKVPGLEPRHQIQFSVLTKTLIGGKKSYPSTEVLSVYSTATTDKRLTI